MKKSIVLALLACVVLSLCGPAWGEEAEGSLFLKVSSITFSLVGESDDIYLGLVPREQVTWESQAPRAVSVENGVLTATGAGSTVNTAESV